MGFVDSEVTKNFFVDSVPAKNRGRCFSVNEMFGTRAKAFIGDSKIHDANFAFLSTSLAKLHKKLYEPKVYFTYQKDIDINPGGGFVDFVTYYTVNWAGIMNEMRNVVGNNANFIPRVNASLTQKNVNVYTYEVAYDLRFIELEKMKKIDLQKSIEEIYRNAILAGWDFFVQKVAYLGLNGGTGLFNDANVKVTTIDNNEATGKGFEGLSDDAFVGFINGIFETYLDQSNMNITLLPNKILVPTFVQSDAVSRYSQLYTNTLLDFIKEHNLGKAQSGAEDFKLVIEARPDLNTAGVGGHGRIVAYRKDEDFVRIDMPYPMQHYITLPNIDKMSYTSAFVGQVSQVQLPYNTSNTELGVVSYWDFTK